MFIFDLFPNRFKQGNYRYVVYGVCKAGFVYQWCICRIIGDKERTGFRIWEGGVYVLVMCTSKYM